MNDDDYKEWTRLMKVEKRHEATAMCLAVVAVVFLLTLIIVHAGIL